MRKFFPAANTPQGFFSRFDSVYDEKDDNKVVFIKGGSGTGKSTLMKKILKDAQTLGFETEAFFCSSDPNSLDGVRIPDKRAVIVDATSPHTQDPLMPGISGKIYNIADFWNEELLIPHKDEIMHLISLKKENFNNCYRYLAAAQTLYPNKSSNLYDIKNICRKFSFPYKDSIGKTRKLFASGITPDGNVNFLEDILVGRIIGIKESPNTSDILKQLNFSANISGYDTELFFCPMFPNEKAEHLVIKELSLSFTTKNEFHSFDRTYETIHFETPSHNNEHIKELLNLAIKSLSDAKTHHKKIEQIYISAMDFEKMDKTYQSISSYLLG